LGKLPPARTPRPAATTTAATEGPIEFPNKTEFFDAGFTAFADGTKGFPPGVFMLRCNTCAASIID
jgi:hypothetical protein